MDQKKAVIASYMDRIEKDIHSGYNGSFTFSYRITKDPEEIHSMHGGNYISQLFGAIGRPCAVLNLHV